jgi:CBS domain-containing protein
MAHGSANDLLAARIYFDLKPLAGNLALARPLQTLLVSPSAAVPRFVKQMADVVLCNHVPLNWLGRVVTDRHLGAPMFDLKMSGTALFVDAARLWALAHSIPATGTMARLRRAAEVLRVPGSECETWLRGFGALQQLRLSVQLERDPATDPLERTWVAWKDLGEAQRAALKSALRAARWVQQRIALDYRR